MGANYNYNFVVTFSESCITYYQDQASTEFLLFLLQSRELLLLSCCLVGNALSAHNLFNKKIRFWAVGAVIAEF